MKKIIFIIVPTLLGGMYLGYLLPKENIGEVIETVSSVRQSGYTYINPLLECENNGRSARQKYIPFENEAISKINKNQIASYSGVTLSVYFRNLNNGPWFGIREDEKYIPASLMKLTLLISYMKWWEEFPGLLDVKLALIENSTMNQFIVPDVKLEPGKEYSVRELLYYLIVYSDNHAASTLLGYIPPEKQIRTFKDLGVPVPDMQNINYSLSTKEYASFFRILYNSSYLTEGVSEESLKILGSTTFKRGLRLGVPEDIRISHKFGERTMLDDAGKTINQLHDCGIVYHPRYPYLLCIMTRGDYTMESLSSLIGDTSKIVFEEIDARFPRKELVER